MLPLTIVHVAMACTVAPPPTNVRVGALVYPLPALVIVTLCTTATTVELTSAPAGIHAAGLIVNSVWLSML